VETKDAWQETEGEEWIHRWPFFFHSLDVQLREQGTMIRIREALRPWWVIGLVGAVANFVLLAAGMGVAVGALPVGLGLGFWVGGRARRLAGGEGEAARGLALWGGLIAGGMAMHAELLYDLVILMLFGPAEIGRPFTTELQMLSPRLAGMWPAGLDSIGAFWILQALGFALTGYALTVITAWLWARHRETNDAGQEMTDERRRTKGRFVVGRSSSVASPGIET